MKTADTRKAPYMQKIDTGYPDYVIFAKDIYGYKWYKPIITGLVMELIAFVLICIVVTLTVTTGGHGSIKDGISFVIDMQGAYDDLDTYTASGIIMALGSAICVLPALFITTKILKYRPFSTYSSSRGGWSWKIFFKSFLIAFIVYGIPLILYELFVIGFDFSVKFSVAGFVLCLILVPLQCVSEEYLYRGFGMQTLGCWFKVPIAAIILQAFVFATAHPYDFLGTFASGLLGFCFGIVAWYTDGIETPSAVHMVNNLCVLLLTGFGADKVKVATDVGETVLAMALGIVYLFAVRFAVKKGFLTAK